MAACASGSDSQPSRRAARIVLFGETTSTPSRSTSNCWQAFHTASNVKISRRIAPSRAISERSV
jgi:hypothetical protein